MYIDFLYEFVTRFSPVFNEQNDSMKSLCNRNRDAILQQGKTASCFKHITLNDEINKQNINTVVN